MISQLKIFYRIGLFWSFDLTEIRSKLQVDFIATSSVKAVIIDQHLYFIVYNISIIQSKKLGRVNKIINFNHIFWY